MRTPRWLFLGSVALALAAYGHAQAPPAAPEFDAVSIRVLPPGGTPAGLQVGRYVTPGRLRYVSVSLEGLIRYAYGLKGYQPVTGGPDWALSSFAGTTTEFVVEATYGDTVKPAQLPQMLQAVLASRFHLALHRVSKEGDVYEMTIAPGGLKIAAYDPAAPAPPAHCCPDEYSPSMAVGGVDSPLGNLVGALTQMAGRPVLDKTGNTAHYTYAFCYAVTDPALLATIRANNPDFKPNDPVPSLPAAVEEQLGLRLTPARGLIEGMVIDYAEMPAPN